MQNKNDKRGEGMSEYDGMMASWQQLREKGVEFYVDGEEVSMKEAFSLAVREDSVYMADYVLGAEGRIQQIRLDKVELK